MDQEKQDIEKYIRHILKNAPHQPGIYKMKDSQGHIIYVGKAKDLKNRLSSYFNSGKDHTVKTEKMVEQIADIDYTVVGSELEALMLETNLIKELRPKYNILMKDDKNYVYIKITTNEDFPRIIITRKVLKDKARYFGPKTAQHKVVNLLKVLKKIFPYRHCQLDIEYERPTAAGESPNPHIKHKVKVSHSGIKYPCLDYHIKRCIGPCIGTVSREEYREMIDQIIRFLEGKQDEIIDKIKAEMFKAAAEKKFEQAASLRDKLAGIEELMETQRVTDPNLSNVDVVNYLKANEKIYFNLFQVREGKLINQENFILNSPRANKDEESTNPEILSSFLEQYYEKATDLPKEILVPHEVESAEILEQWLDGMKGQKVKIITPQKGKKDMLLELSLKNAESYAKQTEVKWQGAEKQDRTQALEELKNLLKLAKTPARLECYDVSHFQGTETVSSMVVFENGFPKKEDYRKFKLHQQTSGSPDDYASMEETLTRRLKYLKPGFEDIKLLEPDPKKLIKILSGFKVKPLKDRKYLIISKDKTAVGHVQLQIINKKALIESIHFSLSVDLPVLIRKTLEKLKIARIYMEAVSKSAGTLEESGFQQIQKAPEEFRAAKGHQILVFDKNKYKSDKSFEKKPDLIIVDGGKGQLNVAKLVLKKFNLAIPLISIAKKEEELFTPSKPAPILLKKDNPLLHLFQHIRDEAHRFAVTYHQNLRNNASTSSILDTIPGIGENLKLKLLAKFGSIEAIKTASLDDLTAVIGHQKAAKIRQML